MNFDGVLEAFDDFTPQRIQSRGIIYAAEGRVGEINFTRDGCEAEVRGSGGKVYDCEIMLKDRETHGIGIYCTCPAFDRENICKHLYATAIKLETMPRDQKGIVSSQFWEDLFYNEVRRPLPRKTPPPEPSEPVNLYYLLDVDQSQHQWETESFLRLGLFQNYQLKNGTRRLKKCAFVDAIRMNGVPDQEKLIISRMHAHMSESFSSYAYAPKKYHEIYLSSDALIQVLEPLAQTERLFFQPRGSWGAFPDSPPLRAALSESWTFELQGTDLEGQLHLQPTLRSADQQASPQEIRFAHTSGYLIWSDRITRFTNPEFHGWLQKLKTPPPPVPAKDVDTFLRKLYELPHAPPVVLPPSLALEEVNTPPTPRLRIEKVHTGIINVAHPEFVYDHGVFAWNDLSDTRTDWDTRKIFRRDLAAERTLLDHLTHLGGSYRQEFTDAPWHFQTLNFADVAETLVRQGWEVMFKRQRLRPRGEFSLQVDSSGIDWFDVRGNVRFGEEHVDLPELLKAAAASLDYIELKNGEIGLIPEAVKAKLALLKRLATANRPEGDANQDQGGGQSGSQSGSQGLRFQGAGSVLLDLLLEEEPYVNWSAAAGTYRERIRKMGHPEAADAPPGFQGTLREYQREGLGWLHYLREIGLNGCLADDMGLGKTVQVLALLEAQRQRGKGPFLVVAPKTLAFNWLQECEKFTPSLRAIALAGPHRPKSTADLPKADLYLISYPLLLRDIGWLKDFPFDTVVLDESQAIKNPKAKTTKAARLLRANHRLTLTGTPVENRLDDLWSQLNFLNPGMLGHVARQDAELGTESLHMISRAVRPFLLRRTKEQVASDLPEKVEETLYCDLPPGQRKLYNDLKTYYRDNLAKGIADKGFGKSKILVLEALLRLRQAACHPGLISEKHARTESAKMATLTELLGDILDSGHKALIFSQFTTLLGLVRERLDREGHSYAYLDGQSRDRQESVHHFQTDPECKLFLISLKAGGVGLNLTATDYVILLDPWWNPAAEAQAIDRAHRIGQNKKVFAYRIVARDTIEEKILALQQEKRQLAEAILTQENALLSKLTPEDLAFLLS